MSLREGAETIVDQCLDISSSEKVVVVNDGNDQDLIDALIEAVESRAEDHELIEYDEPGNHGEEPPEKVAEAMKNSDVFIAPTKKSISHTRARTEACGNGARGATLPGITKEVWKTSLQADYSRVEKLSEKVYSILEKTDKVRIETPSGTDLRFDVDIDSFHTDTGIIHEPGDFGNLPAGEADGGIVNMSGTLVIDHMPFVPEESEGARLEIEGSEVVGWSNLPEGSELLEALESIEGSRNVAEFGFGTNPRAELIDNLLQDEKVLGTVHIALGDNSSYFPEEHDRRVSAGIHWDSVCIEPTVHFDEKKVLDAGEPVFRR